MGSWFPASSHTWVIPSFVPRRAFSGRSVVWGSVVMTKSLQLDLDVDVGWQIQPHQRVNSLWRRINNVDEALVCAHLEVITAVFVLVRRPDDAEYVLLGRQWHRAHYSRSRTFHRVDDFTRRTIDDFVVVGLEPDADFLSRHGVV